MSNQNFTYQFQSSHSPEDIFSLLQDPRKWWWGQYNETIEGTAVHLGDEFSFRAGEGVHYSKHKLVELVSGKRLAWEVTDSKLTFLQHNTGEWIGTHFAFDIAPSDGTTQVTFTHNGLVPALECYKNCSGGWTRYLEALKSRLS